MRLQDSRNETQVIVVVTLVAQSGLRNWLADWHRPTLSGRTEMKSATLKQTSRRVALGVASMMMIALPMMAGEKTPKSSEQCSVAVVTARPGGGKVCDLKQVRNLAAHGRSFEQNQLGIASVLKIGPE